MANDLLSTRFARLFDDTFFNGEAAGRGYAPPVDILEREDAFVLSLDVPGFAEAELSIEYHEGQLKIGGTRELSVPEGSTEHLRERRSGSFTRTFSIPRDVDVENIVAKHENGVLTVTLPKSELAKPRKIEVSTN